MDFIPERRFPSVPSGLDLELSGRFQRALRLLVRWTPVDLRDWERSESRIQVPIAAAASGSAAWTAIL